MTGATGVANQSIVVYLLPSLLLLFTFLGVVVAAYPIWRRHQKKLQLEGKEGARQKATQDAVLGTPADLYTGRPATRGLMLDVQEMVKTVGRTNGTGKTLVDMAEEGLQVASNTASLFNAHAKQDDFRFDELKNMINEKRATNE